MNKREFLARLEEALSGLPRDDAAERLTCYSELIDDRMEDGLTEEAAVAELGPVDKILSQILAETPLPRLVKERMKPTRRFQTWEILLLVLGFPLWFPLLIAAFAILLSLYVALWAVILSLWAAEISLIAGSFGGLAAGLLSVFRGDGNQGLLLIAAGIALAGLSILLFFGCRAVTGGSVTLLKRITLGVKSLFLRKEKKT